MVAAMLPGVQVLRLPSMMLSARRGLLMAAGLGSIASGCTYDWRRELAGDAGRTEVAGPGDLVGDARVEPGKDARIDAARELRGDAARDATVMAPAGEEKDAGQTSDGSGPEKDAAVCERPLVTLTRTLPEVMIVLDNSLSMETGQRWEPASRGIRVAIGDTEEQAALGLAFFPGKSVECRADAPAVVPAAKNAANIGFALDSTRPNGPSPLAAALDSVIDFYSRRPPLSSGAPPLLVAVITDGLPSCSVATDLADKETQQSAARTAVQRLTAAGVVFHAIGYQLDPEAETFLTSLSALASLEASCSPTRPAPSSYPAMCRR